MRAGLTGLGIVFLFTIAAAAAFGPSDGDPSVEQQDKVPGEPLAQLGVAPGPEKDRQATPEPGELPAGPAAEPAPATESPASILPDPGAGPPPGGDRPVRI